MRFPVLISASCLALCAVASAQLKFQRIEEPLGDKLDKALKTSALIQPGAKPFHVKLDISAAKGDAETYAATVEETWISSTQWSRSVTAKGLSQKTVMNSSGLHIATTGDYYPRWLRSFVTGLFSPVPDADVWDRAKPTVDHIEMANGAHSDPCAQLEFNLGKAPLEQVNFAHVCFKDGLLQMVQSPEYTVDFSDYAAFGHLKVPRTLGVEVMRGISLRGKVVVLEPVETVAPKMFETPEGATDNDPLRTVIVATDQLMKLAGGPVDLPWPSTFPGQGMFTVWVVLDRTGVIREAQSLNSDESGIAGDMAPKLLGRHWKQAIANGVPVQVQGAMVFAYPPTPAAGEAGKSPA
jgi:hypothetical protein